MSEATAYPEEDEVEATRMTLAEHLGELRTRLVRGAAVLMVTFAVAFAYHERVADIVLLPQHRAITMLNERLVEIYEERLAADPSLDRSLYFDPPDSRHLAHPIPIEPRGDGAQSGFMFYLKASFLFALAIAGPYMLWEMWRFVAAGLYRRERRIVYRYFPLSGGLFAAGILFGYTTMVPYGYYFLVEPTLGQIRHDPEIGIYFSFLVALLVALGIVFQLPIVMIALSKVGLVDPRAYARFRPYFVVLALVIGAILTPPDPITQMLMAGPMVVLYELGYRLARWSAPPPSPAEAEDPEEEARPA